MVEVVKFDPLEEVSEGIALYAHLLRSLIKRLADRGILDRGDLLALSEAVEAFPMEDEHMPEAVERHTRVLVKFLASLPAAS